MGNPLRFTLTVTQALILLVEDRVRVILSDKGYAGPYQDAPHIEKSGLIMTRSNGSMSK